MTTQGELVFVGCYTAETGGEGAGITLMHRDPSTGDLTPAGVAARAPSPSFLARHPALPVLYAANELDAGAITAFAVAADGSLSESVSRSTGGAHPCHVAVTPDGRHLLAANYSSGSVSVHPLDTDGRPAERTDLLQLGGRGPDPERQEGPHAHMVAPGPDGGVLVVDLGSDRVWHCRLDPRSGRLTGTEPAVVTQPGTGPRHLRRTPDGTLLLVGELNAELSWYRPGPDGLRRAGGVPATTRDGADFPSELATDGRFVYVANRGPDTVSVFGWDGEAATPVAEVPTGGSWPRHIALIGSHLYVANERSHSVTIFRLDAESGIPQPQGGPVGGGSPTCVLPWNSDTMHR